MTCDLMNWERPLGGEVSRLTAEHRWIVCPYRQKLQLCNVSVSQNSVEKGRGLMINGRVVEV
jgi:hypothetical protein